MRVFLDEYGRLLPPSSREEGLARVKQLQHEAAKISKQLRENFGDTRGKEWTRKACIKLDALREEEKQLAVWLAGWEAASKIG